MKKIRAFLLAVVAVCLAACVADNPEMVKSLTEAGFTNVQQINQSYRFTGRIGRCEIDFLADGDGKSYTVKVDGVVVYQPTARRLTAVPAV